MSESVVRIVPLGGLGEYGMNCMLIETDEDQIMVDCGVLFPDEEHLGLDLIIPDFSYLVDDSTKRFRGLVVTHGHEDHIGAIPYLIKEIGSFPIYGTAFTLALIRRRLEEHNLAGRPELIELRVDKPPIEIGPFSVDPIHVNHSAPATVSLALRTPVGVIIATGDWRVDHTPIGDVPIDLAKFARYGSEGVLALIADSTNIDVPGTTASELEVSRSLEDLMDIAPGRVFITLFSSHMWRVQGIIQAAYRTRRKVIICGRSMSQNFEVARDMGLMKVPDDDIILDERDFERVPPEELVVIVAGSQGEHRSSLSRLARNDHRRIHADEGDYVIYSARVIPGNEKAVARVRDRLWKLGAELITPNERQVHTSGHGLREELKLMIRLTRPEILIPVHGEYQQMYKHARLGRELGVPEAIVIEDGEVLEIDSDGNAERVGTVETGKVFVDGSGVGDVEENVLRERRRMAASGAVVVRMTMARDSGEILVEPQLELIGVAHDVDESLLDSALEVVRDKLHRQHKKGQRKPSELAETMRLAVRRFFKKELRRRPVIVPIVDVVG